MLIVSYLVPVVNHVFLYFGWVQNPARTLFVLVAWQLVRLLPRPALWERRAQIEPQCAACELDATQDVRAVRLVVRVWFEWPPGDEATGGAATNCTDWNQLDGGRYVLLSGPVRSDYTFRTNRLLSRV